MLNLGLFNSMQSLQYTFSTNSISEHIECVKNGFNELNVEKLDVFLLYKVSLKQPCWQNGPTSTKFLTLTSQNFVAMGDYNQKRLVPW